MKEKRRIERERERKNERYNIKIRRIYLSKILRYLLKFVCLVIPDFIKKSLIEIFRKYRSKIGIIIKNSHIHARFHFIIFVIIYSKDINT